MLTNRSSKLAMAAAAVAVAALALVGCSGGGGTGDQTSPGDSATPVAGGSIVVGGLVKGPIDPGQATFSTQFRPWALSIFGSLFWPQDYGTTGDYVPGLASGYKYSDDQLTLTITLRPDLVYSDGTPLDADSLVWNLNRHIENKTREFQYFQYVTNIQKVDDLNVAITFSQPQSILLDAMATSSTGFVVSEPAFEKEGADAFAASPVGAGPFKIDNATPGQELDLSKNDSYYDAANVYLDKVTWLNVGTDSQAWLTNLQSGTIQAIQMNGTNTSAAVLDAIKGDSTLQLSHGLSTYVSILPENTEVAPFNDENARLAVMYCTDREALATSIFKGYANPAFVLSGDTWALGSWQDGKALDPIQYDTTKGKALVDQLGGLNFTIVTNETAPLITALQQQWQECGINAQVKTDPSYLDSVKNGNYQMAYTTNTNGGLNPASSTNYLDPTSANNGHGWKDDAIWNLVVQAKGTVDQTAATALWKQIWTGLTSKGYIPSIVSAPNYVGSSAKLHGIQQSVTMDLTHAWLEP